MIPHKISGREQSVEVPDCFVCMNSPGELCVVDYRFKHQQHSAVQSYSVHMSGAGHILML